MVEHCDSVTQHGPQYIEDLPSSVSVYHYSGMDDFCRLVSLQRSRLYRSFYTAENQRARNTNGNEGPEDDLDMSPQTEGTQSNHIIFIVEPSTFFRDFDLLADRPFHDRISFNPKTSILVVKIPLPTHHQAVAAFDETLKWALGQMGLHRALLSWGSSTLTGGDGTIKEPDAAWGPRQPPRCASKTPSLVLEVAMSETSAKLRRDAQYWVDPTRGLAGMAIAVAVHAKKPQITIEQWEWNSQLSRLIQGSSLAILKSDGEVRFHPDRPTPQLLIPFHLLFRRPAEGDKERDIVFGTQELVEFATLVWDMQFDNKQE
ncbi:unnamed protein product [Penicillium salamii]|uniref:Uncharacterized protein n=1 Tax=Penicillium salamii TaxID=1612424 RepID=A0A9W4JRP0_9EURO|nr:unnamed protein product [Penicillium salamii]